jgi:hypothetical protein
LFNNAADAKAAANLVYDNGLGTLNHTIHMLKGGGRAWSISMLLKLGKVLDMYLMLVMHFTA